jgi:MGT family glycosyltransferase
LLRSYPEHIILRNYVPQLEILKQADVIISHGGLNSVSEALYYGVPVIAIPLSNDQPAVAKRVTELGAGIELKMEEVTPDLLSQTVYTVLSDPSYHKNSLRIGDGFRQAGGYQKAADIIESLCCI